MDSDALLYQASAFSHFSFPEPPNWSLLRLSWLPCGVFSKQKSQQLGQHIRQFMPLSCLKSSSGFFQLQPDTQWPSRPNMIHPLFSKSFTLFLAHSFLFTLGSFLFCHIVPTSVPLHMMFPLFKILLLQISARLAPSPPLGTQLSPFQLGLC